MAMYKHKHIYFTNELKHILDTQKLKLQKIKKNV